MTKALELSQLPSFIEANTTNLVVNATSYAIGSSFVANTTGVYHTGVINSSSISTTGFVGNTTAIIPTSNTILLGSSTGRFVLSANTGDFTGTVSYTLTGTATTGGSQIYLNGATMNRVDFNTNGVAAPTYTTRSAGTKVALYPALGASSVDYALGIDAGALWASIPGNDAGQFFKWYGGETQVGSLSGTGMMNITGAANAASHTVGTDFIANTTGVYHTGVLSVGNTTTQHILPAANITYDIGSSTMRYRDLYLSGNTINLGDIKLSTNGTAFSVANATGGVFPSALGNTTVTGTLLTTNTITVGNSTVNSIIHTTGITANGASIHGINANNIATGTLDVARISNSSITATKLAANSAAQNIGYIPLGPAYVVIGTSTDSWHDLDSLVLGAGDGVIKRRARYFTSVGTNNILTARINYGWASYFFRIHLYEIGYLGTAYRSATFSQHGSGTNIVAGSYSPYWRYEINSSTGINSLAFTGSGPSGGGVDVGYYDVNAQVSIGLYSTAYIVVEYGQNFPVSGSNPPPKNNVYFY